MDQEDDFEFGVVMPDDDEEDAKEVDNEVLESDIWGGGVENDDNIYLAKAKGNKPNDGLEEDVI
mgnify:CR=1 FL=1